MCFPFNSRPALDLNGADLWHRTMCFPFNNYPALDLNGTVSMQAFVWKLFHAPYIFIHSFIQMGQVYGIEPCVFPFIWFKWQKSMAILLKWHTIFMHFPFNGSPASNLMGSNDLCFPLNSYPVPNLTAYNCVHFSPNDNPASDCTASRITSHHFPHPRAQTESSHRSWTPSLPAVHSAMSQRLLG